MKITKNKNGTYTTVIAIRDIKGKRHMKRFTGRDKAQVQMDAANFMTTHRVYIESDAFCDVLRRYIDQSREVLSPSTIRGYTAIQRCLEGYQTFMNTPVDRITAKQLQALSDHLHSTRKAKTVRNIMGLVSATMSYDGYRMPPVKIRSDAKFNPHVPTVEEMKLVAETAKGTRWEAVVGLACMGLRRGEIAAVRSSDLNGNILHVSHAIALDEDNFKVDKCPKTASSDRYIPIPDRIADIINEQGKAWEGSLNSLTGGFKLLVRRAGVEHFRLHDCRHFFASYCHDVLKLSDAQIMKLGGWSTDNVMKRVYITAITDDSIRVQQSIGSFF